MDRFRSTFSRDRSLRARRAHISNIDMTQGNWRMMYFTYLYEKKQQNNEVMKGRRSRLNVDPLQTLFKECRCWKSNVRIGYHRTTSLVRRIDIMGVNH